MHSCIQFFLSHENLNENRRYILDITGRNFILDISGRRYILDISDRSYILDIQVGKIVSPNALPARGEMWCQVTLSCSPSLEQATLPIVSSNAPSARGGRSSSIMFDNLITPCILSPLTSSVHTQCVPSVTVAVSRLVYTGYSVGYTLYPVCTKCVDIWV